MRIIVVGAGVVGLSCAVRLLEAGHRVDVVARDLPRETTSAVAAAIWYPYRALPQDRVTAWAAASYAVFAALAAPEEYGGSPEVGVRMVPGTELFTSRAGRPVVAARPCPGWTGSATCRPASSTAGLQRAGHRDAGLPDLADRPARGLGGTLTRLNLRALPAGADLVVNCSGLGARLLGEDRSVVPVRGQVVYVEQVGVDRWWLDAGDGPTYVVPRGREIVVGGTDQEGSGAGRPPRRRPRRSSSGRRGWCPSCATPGCSGTRSGCGRSARPSGSNAGGPRRALLRPRRRGRDARAGGARRTSRPWSGRRAAVPPRPGCVFSSRAWRRAGARSRRCRAARRSRRSRRRSRGRWRAPGPAA